jgi:hypothetical protein
MDLTLNSIMIPNLRGYTPPFGTKVTTGIDPYSGLNNKGGLNIQQVNDNIIAPFVKMRAVTVSDNTSTGAIEYDAKIFINAANPSTLTLGNASYIGCVVTVINSTNIEHTLVHNVVEGGTTTVKQDTIVANTVFKVMWNGSRWQNVLAPAVGKRITQYPQEKYPTDIYPCTEWEEITDYNGAFFRTEGGNADAFIEENGTLTPQSQGTAKNGLSFSGKSGMKSGNQSSNPNFTAKCSHDHAMNVDTTIVGSGWDHLGKGYGFSSNGSTQKSRSGQTTGINEAKSFNISYTPTNDYTGTVSGNHKHTFTTQGSIVTDLIEVSQGVTRNAETRPINLTVKIWKRVA